MEKETAKKYDEIAERYYKHRKAGKAFINEYVDMPAVLSLLKSIRHKKLLDLGCGPGIYAEILKKRGASVWGVDISAKEIDIAKANTKGVDFRVGSAYNIPFKSNYFDIVVSALAVEYFDKLDLAFSEITRVLKKNGTFIFSVGNPVLRATVHKRGTRRNLRRFVDYFKEGQVLAKWALGHKRHRIKMSYMGYTLETYIKALRRHGFIIDDYIDAKPLESKRKQAGKWLWIYKVPYISVFKARKVK